MKKNYAYSFKNNQPHWGQLHLVFFSVILFIMALCISNTANATTSTSETANGSLSVWLSAAETGKILDCYTKEVTIESYVSKDGPPFTDGLTYSWTGPNGFTSDLKDITVTVPGFYKLTAKSETGEYANNSITVYGYNYPAKFAGADKKLYSSTETVTLGGYAHGLNGTVHENYTVSWEASNGGNIISGANTLRPVVDAPGTYTITLTHTSGCTMQDSMVVTEAEDVLFARFGNGGILEINCDGDPIALDSYITLNGNQVTEGIIYSWTGPNSYTSEAPSAKVNEPGNYTLEVIHLATGLKATATQSVSKMPSPEGSAGPDKVLTCNNPTVTLEGSVINNSGSPIWLASDGGNFVSGYRTLNPVVDAPGTYTLILQNFKGCSTKYTVKVTRDEGPSVSATGGKLDCSSGSAQLTGSSDREGATYSWTGPNGYTSTEQNPMVRKAGDYTLIVTDPETGCSASTMVAVTPSSSELTIKEYLIDFNSEKNGLISSIETDAGPVSIIGRKRNPGNTETYASENHAAIFNTQAPTGDDTDLYTTDWGRVLIINTDQSEVPDDNQWGGELILDFSAIGPVTLESMGLLDLDHYEDMSWVYMYDEAGKELHKIHLKTMGNNSKQTVDLGNTRGVTMLKVVLDGRDGSGHLAGSGAIDDIRFQIETEVASPCENAQQQEAMQALAYPTTFSDRATVQFTLQDGGDYAVNLYDTQGNIVRELQTGTAMANEQISIEVAAGSLKEGMYMARIMSPAGSKTLKLILKR